MRIAVIGGAGKMGRWLVNHFQKLDHTIIIADPRRIEVDDLVVTESNTTAVVDADVVFISVPMENMVDVIQEVVPHMKSKSILCEISTMKTNVFDTLIGVSSQSVKPLSLHPLFGPGATTLRKRFAMIPVRNLDDEKNLAEALFPDSEVIVVEKEDHERIMALTLSLPYFANMILASMVKDEDIQLMEQLSGTTFALQFLLTGSIMSHSSGFHVALHSENKYALEILSNFQNSIERELSILAQDRKAFEESYQTLQAKLGDRVDLESKYKEMYRVLNVMKNQGRVEP
jgi:prephenate dehydrogenase